MITDKPHINVVWLKRDLRLEDNEAISNALVSGRPDYCFTFLNNFCWTICIIANGIGILLSNP